MYGSFVEVLASIRDADEHVVHEQVLIHEKGCGNIFLHMRRQFSRKFFQ